MFRAGSGRLSRCPVYLRFDVDGRREFALLGLFQLQTDRLFGLFEQGDSFAFRKACSLRLRAMVIMLPFGMFLFFFAAANERQRSGIRTESGMQFSSVFPLESRCPPVRRFRSSKVRHASRTASCEALQGIEISGLGVEVELGAYRTVAELGVCQRRGFLDVGHQPRGNHAQLTLGQFVGFETAQYFRFNFPFRFHSQCLSRCLAGLRALNVANVPIPNRHGRCDSATNVLLGIARDIAAEEWPNGKIRSDVETSGRQFPR